MSTYARQKEEVPGECRNETFKNYFKFFSKTTRKTSIVPSTFKNIFQFQIEYLVSEGQMCRLEARRSLLVSDNFEVTVHWRKEGTTSGY